MDIHRFGLYPKSSNRLVIGPVLPPKPNPFHTVAPFVPLFPGGPCGPAVPAGPVAPSPTGPAGMY